MRLVTAQRAMLCGRAALLLTLALLSVRTLVPRAEAGDLSTAVRLSIPAQALESALRALADQADIQIMFSSKDVVGITAPSVSGEMSARDALALMLRSTALQFKAQGKDTVVVRHKGPAAVSHGRPIAPRGDTADVEPASLKEVVVTARKRAENVLDIPVSIAVVTAGDIEERGLLSEADYLRGMPGVNEVDGFNSQSISIRGIQSSPSLENFSSGPTFATYFGETPTTNTGGLVGDANVDLKLVDIERVEVLRGPQGTAFGDSSLGGAVRTIPVAPKLNRSEATLNAGYSNTAGTGGNNYNVHAITNLPLLQDKLALRLVGYWYQDSGYYRNVAGSSATFLAGPATHYGAQAFAVDQDDVGLTRFFGGRASALFQPTDALRITLNYLYQNTQQNGTPLANSGTYEQTVFVLPAARVERGQTGGFTDSHIDVLNPVIEYRLSWADLVATYSHTRSSSSQADQSSVTSGVFWPFSYLADGDHGENVGEIRLATHFDGAWNFLVGAFAEKLQDHALFTYFWYGSAASDSIAAGQTGLLGTYVDVQSLTQRSAYAEVYWRLLPRLTLTGGGRYYHYNREVSIDTAGPYLGGATSTTNAAGANGVSPRGDISYKINDDTLVYARYSQGFRLGKPQPGLAAGFCDLNGDGIVDGTNTSIASTRSLNSDEVRSYEIGSKLALLDRQLTLDFDVFRMNWSGVPVRVVAPPKPIGCGLAYNANAGDARSDGVEFHASYRIARQWTASLGASWVHARLAGDVPALRAKAGDRLPGSPEENGDLSLQYAFDILNRKAFVRADAVYVGSSYGDLLQSESLRSDAYVKVDATAGVALGNVNAHLFIHNLTDSDAFTFRGTSAAVSPFFGYRLQPRTIGVQLEYNF